MNAYKRMLLAGFCAGSTILAFGSQAQAAKAASPKVDKTSAAIAAYADELVIPTYKTMSDNALKFAKAAKELKAAPTDAKVAEAGKLLLETRVPWELSESFLFGPAAFANLDPKLDSWPLDTTNLDAEGFALRLFQVGVVVLDRGQGVEHRRALSGPVYGGCSG